MNKSKIISLSCAVVIIALFTVKLLQDRHHLEKVNVSSAPPIGGVPRIDPTKQDPKQDPKQDSSLEGRIRLSGASLPTEVLNEIDSEAQGLEKDAAYALLAEVLSSKSVEQARNFFLDLAPSSAKQAALNVVLTHELAFDPSPYATKLAEDEVTHLVGLEKCLKAMPLDKLHTFILSGDTGTRVFPLIASKAYGLALAERFSIAEILQAPPLQAPYQAQALRFATDTASRKSPSTAAAEILAAYPDMRIETSQDILTASATAFARARPQDAVDFYVLNQAKSGADRALRAVFLQWAQLDPIAASSRAKTLGATPVLYDAAAAAIASYCVSNQDFQGAEAWISTIKDPLRKKESESIVPAGKNRAPSTDPSGSIKIE